MTPLVLLPGMDGTGRLFDGFRAALRGEATPQVVAYSRDASLGYDALTEYVLARLPRSGPFYLLGESFSGPIAVRVAAECRQRVRGLILACSFLRAPRPWLAALAARSPLPPTRLLAALLLGRGGTPALRTQLKEVLEEVGVEVLRARLAEVARVDVVSQAETLRLPLLYLQAERDGLVPAAAARLVAAAAPRTRVVRLPGPHFLLQTHPLPAAAAVERFLAEVDSEA